MSRSARLSLFTSLVFAAGCFQDFDIQPNDASPGSTGTGGDTVSDTLSSGGSRGSGGAASDDGDQPTSLDGGSQSDSGSASEGGNADAGDQTGTSNGDGDGGDGSGSASASAGDDTAADSGTEACLSGSELVFDGSFEAAALNPDNTSPFWEESYPDNYSIICDSSCAESGGYAASDGDWWAWFGGTGTAGVWSLEQNVILPAGATLLDFNLRIPEPESLLLVDTLEVRIDGQAIYTITAGTTGYDTWTPVQVDIAAFANGAAHTLSFVGDFSANGFGSEFLLDEVSITCD